jgi:hypothetical protein
MGARRGALPIVAATLGADAAVVLAAYDMLALALGGA